MPEEGLEPGEDITGVLQRWSVGDPASEPRLAELLHRELRRLARMRIRSERADHTLQTTALVHEVYLRLFPRQINWENRAHFFAVASNTMRRILVDYARKRHADKRDAGVRVILEAQCFVSEDQLERVIQVDEALTKLAAVQPRQGRVVELHVFGGLTMIEAAGVLGISPRTAKRDWEFAKAWLFQFISGQSGAAAE